MPLTPGTRLGPYEIVAPLGAGGMGEVYRANDSRLGRSVAVKVLPQHLSSTSEVRARFEREARTISSLNHPHICVLHDVGREGDTDYLVMELVEGETLAQRLSRGALPTADVLKIGAQIADALDRAHRAGVIHRDLKPANVMLTKSGVKLLDFGLARATGLAGAAGSALRAGLSNSPTIAQPLTAEGTLVGTFQYMAPEQLEGREADARADLWSFGCVLYEMTTGRRAFDGATQASLISSIMRDTPRAMSELSPMSPPALERLVLQCLAKDPDDRWQSAGDVRRELEWIANGTSQSGARPVAPAPAKPAVSPLAVAAWAAVLLAALLIAFRPWQSREAPPRLMRFTVEAPKGTFYSSPAEAELSPDGRMLAFIAADSLGASQLYVRALASPEARLIPGAQGASLPFWSPDSRALGFFASGKLKTVALDGNSLVTLCDAPDGRGGTWSKRGEIVFAPNNQGPLARVSAGGGTATPVTQMDARLAERGHRYPQFLPDGTHFLFVAIMKGEQVATYAASLDGGARTEVVRAGSMARYVEPGWLLYLDKGVDNYQRRLIARRFDAARRRASGDPRLLLDQVNSTNFGYTNVTAAPPATLVVEHWDLPHASVLWRARNGARLGTVIDDISGFILALSPDGGRLAYSSLDPEDLMVRDLRNGGVTRLTFDGMSCSDLTWSPDGKRIAYARLSQSHGWELCVKNADGSGPASVIVQGPGFFNYPRAWSPDARWLLALSVDSTGQADLWRVPMTGGGSPEIYEQTPATEAVAVLSPDGAWMAYTTIEGNRRSLFVQSFPTPGSKYEIPIEGATGVWWDSPGTELIVSDEQNQVLSVPLSTKAGFHAGSATRLFSLTKDEYLVNPAPGGQRFMLATTKDPSALSRLEVVLGWTQLLDRAK